MCTPGTYLLVDSYAKFVDTWVIANKANARHADIVRSFPSDGAAKTRQKLLKKSDATGIA